MFFSETDFHLQRHAAERRWGLALSLALAAHVVLFILAIYLPSFFESRVIREEVVAVSLVSLPEEFTSAGAEGTTESSPPPVAEPGESPPEPVAPPAEPPPSPPSSPSEPVPVPPEPVVVPVPPQPTAEAVPVSLVAEQRKVKVAQDTRLEEEKVRERAVTRQQDERELARRIEERQRQVEQRLQAEQQEVARREAQRREVERQREIAARAEQERRRADEELRRLRAEVDAADAAAVAARNAAAREAQLAQGAVNRPSSGRQQARTAVEGQYLDSVAQRVRSFWVLPEMRSWDPTLLAQVVITINKEGEVLRIQFEQPSRDPLFDQLVERTIRSASPMPRFPAIMQKETMEVGFNFKPGDLGNM